MLRLINSAYRSNAEQLRFYTAWIVFRKVLAAKPGTSLHNFGRALDIDSNPATADHAWMVAHGREYGWIQTIPHIEPWHFEYVAALDQHRGDRIAALTPITRKENPMFMLAITTTGEVHLVTDRGSTKLAQAEYNLLVRLKSRDQGGNWADPKHDPFLAGEISIMSGAIRRANQDGDTVGAVTSTVDYAALARAVNDDAAARMKS